MQLLVKSQIACSLHSLSQNCEQRTSKRASTHLDSQCSFKSTQWSWDTTTPRLCCHAEASGNVEALRTCLDLKADPNTEDVPRSQGGQRVVRWDQSFHVVSCHDFHGVWLMFHVYPCLYSFEQVMVMSCWDSLCAVARPCESGHCTTLRLPAVRLLYRCWVGLILVCFHI